MFVYFSIYNYMFISFIEIKSLFCQTSQNYIIDFYTQVFTVTLMWLGVHVHLLKLKVVTQWHFSLTEMLNPSASIL